MYDIVIGRSEKEKKELGTDGAIFLGRHYVQMGQTTSLSNNIYMDVNKSHVVFVCGKRGSGKCLTGDTLITLEDGRVVPIKDLEKENADILSLENDYKLRARSRQDFYKRTVNTILKMKLRSGKEISLTPEHPLLTVKGWKQAQELLIGSRIATPRIESVFGDKLMPENEVKILAYLLAEGHLSNKNILFSNKDEEIVTDYCQAIKSFNPELEIKEFSSPHCYAIRGRKPKERKFIINRDEKGRFAEGTMIDNRSNIRKWLDGLGVYGKLAKERAMPECIFTLPKHQLSLFLNRLFSCDGSIYESSRNWEVSYSSSSKSFIKEISHLLLRFGIVSKIRKKYSKKHRSYSYEIIIGGEFVHAYLQEIGFSGEKAKRGEKALVECVKIRRNTNTDTLPIEIWNSYKPENWAAIGRKKIGYKHPKALRESKRYAPSRQKLLQIAIADEQEELVQLADSDIFWDEIVSIQKKQGNFKVYDISVPGTHNFVANDIIVHNSYSMGVMAEGIAGLPPEIRRNLSIIIIDTMGVYWSMKYPNRQDRKLLEEWDLEGDSLDITIYTPSGYFQKAQDAGIPVDYPFAVRVSELDAHDWQMTFEVEGTSELGVLIERIINHFQDREEGYDIDDIVKAIEEDTESGRTTKAAAKNRFLAAKEWGIFSIRGTPLAELARPGQVTVLDISAYATMPGSWNIKNLVTGLVSEKLFIERMAARKEEEFQTVHAEVEYYEKQAKKRFPLVWLVIDEAHEFLPNDRTTLATEPLVTILREGRQPGISLVLASQQPGKIHTDVLTQSDIVISHRITAKIDTDALGTLMQSYMRNSLDKFIDGLPREKGAAIILDDNNEKMYPMRVRPRITWHGGSAPSALPDKEELLL